MIKIVGVEIWDPAQNQKVGYDDQGDYFPDANTMKLYSVRWSIQPVMGMRVTIRGNRPDGSLFANDMTISHEIQGFTQCWFN